MHDRTRETEFIPLARKFYEPSAEVVAPLLLGHWLMRKTPGGLAGGIIVETEAYLANDPACHGYRRETLRNGAMYGPPGRAYVYFIYGNHYCFNAVCRPTGVAEAVLVRAIEATVGEDLMRANRPVRELRQLTGGPAKLCEALAIDRTLDGVDICDRESPVFIARNPAIKAFVAQKGPLVATTRIGLSKAAELQLRYYLAGSTFISRPGSQLLPEAGSVAK